MVETDWAVSRRRQGVGLLFMEAEGQEAAESIAVFSDRG